jgi:hypothetical protein
MSRLRTESERSGMTMVETGTAFELEFERFRSRLSDQRGFAMDWSDRRPCLEDRTATTGFDRHYIYHTAWAARVLAEARPAYHVDIASALYFATIVSAFVPVKYFEYRPVAVEIGNLTCGHADLQRLPFADASLPSVSCMHVVEHVGLGRYGDPIDPDADLVAMRELQRVTQRELLFVVPVGRPRIQFNAHRIYSYDQVIEAFAGMELVEFALVPDRINGEGLIRHATRRQADAQGYGCGCFRFRRPQ